MVKVEVDRQYTRKREEDWKCDDLASQVYCSATLWSSKSLYTLPDITTVLSSSSQGTPCVPTCFF